MPLKPAKTLACLALWLAGYGAAHAQSCHVNGAFSMDFGQVTASGREAASNLSYTCAPNYATNTTLYYQVCIYLYPGDWSAGQPTRRMTNYAGSYLNYDLFSDPAHTQLIGAPGTTPVYQIQTSVSANTPHTTHAPIYGWVYPGQVVPASRPFQEQSTQGLLRYRYSSANMPALTSDCSAGGDGGSSVHFSSSGVLATYDDACWIVASDMDFGMVVAPRQALRTESSIRVQCAPGAVWRVGLSSGQNFDGTGRRMAGAAGYVRYQLYSDESHSQVWGDDETSRVTGVTNNSGTTASLTVYGEVPPQGDLAIGSYSDTIIATLYY